MIPLSDDCTLEVILSLRKFAYAYSWRGTPDDELETYKSLITALDSLCGLLLDRDGVTFVMHVKTPFSRYRVEIGIYAYSEVPVNAAILKEPAEAVVEVDGYVWRPFGWRKMKKPPRLIDKIIRECQGGYKVYYV